MHKKDIEFQRRHFEWIADTISVLPEEQRNNVAGAFALRLKLTNDRFDVVKFLQRCIGGEQ